jgi:tetratricopeptide (TPR) repeat protein
VAEICRRVDCLPLGIELAAARTRELAPGELLALLPSPLELASGAARDRPARQQTLRATIDWSHELLTSGERRLFARLAVFAGGCTLAAARAVCDADRGLLAALVAKGLLRERAGVGGEPRFVMLETVREYALEQLSASDEEVRMRERHAQHELALAEEFEAGLLAGVELRPWLDRLSAEHDNIRAALAWAEEECDAELELRIATPLRPFWQLRGHVTEGRGRLEAALDHGPSVRPEVRAKALWTTGVLAFRQLDLSAARALWEESLKLFEALGDRTGIARSLAELGLLAIEEGDSESAYELYERGAAIFREDGDDRRLAVVVTNLGTLALERGDYDEARRQLETSLELVQKVGDDEGMAESLRGLGTAAIATGATDRARDLLTRSLALSAQIGFPESVAYCLSGLGHVTVFEGDAPRAATLLGAAEGIVEEIGGRMLGAEQRLHEAALDEARHRLGDERLETAVAAGRDLGLEQAVAIALAPTTGVGVEVAAEPGA